MLQTTTMCLENKVTILHNHIAAPTMSYTKNLAKRRQTERHALIATNQP